MIKLKRQLFILNIDPVNNTLFISSDKSKMYYFALDLKEEHLIKQKSQKESIQKYITYFDSSFDVVNSRCILGNPVDSVLLLTSENLKNGKLKMINMQKSEIKSIRYGRFSNLILSGNGSKLIHITNGHSLKQISIIKNKFKGTINAIRFYDNDQKFVVGCWGKSVGFFHVNKAFEVIHSSTFNDNIFTIEVSRDYKYFSVAGWCNKTRIFELTQA